jgi:hypothetical protein
LSIFLQVRYKMNDEDFTRRSKQSFGGTLLLMINMLTKSLSLEIVNFVNHIRRLGCIKQESFTKSAFVQCRKKISPEVFKYLSCMLVDEFYTDNSTVKYLHGFRVVAVDGSMVDLPITKELESIYGKVMNQTNTYVVQARVSVLYDVLNNMALDAKISSSSIGERHLATEHLAHCKENDLILYDRGYPSYEFIYEHFQSGCDYLIRVKADFNKEIKSFAQSKLLSQLVEIYPSDKRSFKDKAYTPDTPIRVRLICVELDNGQKEYLITSLLDEHKYAHSLFKELYFKRWAIETFYDELKNKLKLEHFSGYSNHSILQDFHATIFVSNVQSLIVGELNEELQQAESTKKYQYKVNTSLSYGFLKNRVISLFFSSSDMEKVMSELKGLLAQHLVPIRPNRSNKRNMDKYKLRNKPKVAKNQKEAI